MTLITAYQGKPERLHFVAFVEFYLKGTNSSILDLCTSSQSPFLNYPSRPPRSQPRLRSIIFSSEAIMKAVGKSTWKGTWKEGSGTISTASDTLKEKPYSFSSRFEGTPGASPEELLAAAQAGCFNQALANNFGMIGLAAETIDTSATVELGTGVDGFPAIVAVSVTTNAKVPNISQERFEYCAERARVHCSIAKLIKVDIELTAKLLQ